LQVIAEITQAKKFAVQNSKFKSGKNEILKNGTLSRSLNFVEI